MSLTELRIGSIFCLLLFCLQYGNAEINLDEFRQHSTQLDSVPNYVSPFRTTYTQAKEVSRPWASISITEGDMKPFYPPAAGAGFPWIPVVAGVAGAGVVTYLLVKPDDDDSDCSFNVSTQFGFATCDQPNGWISLTVTPEADYTYSWSNGSSSRDLTDLLPGTYTCTVTRTGTACMEIVSASINNVDELFFVSINGVDADCGLENGSVSAIVTGTGSYSYLWSDGSTTSTVSDLPPGTYSVTVTSEGKCEDDASTTIDENPPNFNVSVSTTPAGCGENDGTASVQVSPSGSYSFLWSNGATTQDISNVSPGTYTVTITSGESCSLEETVIIEEATPAFTVTVNTTPSSCGMSDGMATAEVSPSGIYTFQWSNGEMSESISGLSPGTYMVTVSVPGSNCAVSESVTIEEGPPAFDITDETFPSDCGLSTGSVMLTVVPDGNYSFQWSNGGSSSQQNDLSAGSYQVTVTLEGTDCSKEYSVTIDELPPTMMLSFNSTPAGCGIANGSATVEVNPPGAYDYLWSNGITASSITDILSGEYTVTVSIAGTTCSVTGMVEVGQTGGGFTATFNTANANCGLEDGQASITLDPPGEYTFLWSNQQTEPNLTDVESGTYMVTVTDENGCTEKFTVSIGESPVEYLTINSTSPANCVESGELIFTLTTPGAGPLVVEVVGPEGVMVHVLMPGTHMLSTFQNVPGGEYMLTVYDDSIGENCTDMGSAIVIDNTPDLVANDDFFTTPAAEPISGNALINDMGLSLEMTEVFNIFGGMVSFDATGDFLFTPDPGFTGEASFFYTVTDACGRMANAVVTIFVEMVDCEFDVDFEMIPASCGLEDGSITVEVLEPGEYEYTWSNGETGNTLTDVEAGSYTVTIMDVNLGCDLVFSVDLEELPPDYVSDIVVTQPQCGAPGEIQFTASTSSQNPMVMSVTHPNGIEVFFIDPGVIILSDYVPIVPGEYSIEVTDAGAGPDCFETFEVIINPSAQIEIMVEAVFPPTEPTSMDGSAIIVITVPGAPPYTVLLDGNPIFDTSDEVFTIEGLDVGQYTVQIIDSEGCTSNEVIIDVPFPGISFSFGTGLIFSVPDQSDEQPAFASGDYMIRNAVIVSAEYWLGTIPQEMRLTFAPGVNGKPYGEVLSYSGLLRHNFNKGGVSLQAGIGSAFGSHPVAGREAADVAPLWSLRGSAVYRLNKKVRLTGAVSQQGWQRVQRPSFELSALFRMRGSE